MRRLAVIDVNMKKGEAASTYRVGFLPKGTRYKEVVKVFGKPRNDWTDGGDKVQVQWVGEINKQTFTIYDYDSDKSVESNTDWHVGGHDESVLAPVLEYFNSKSGRASIAANPFSVNGIKEYINQKLKGVRYRKNRYRGTRP